MPLTRSSCFYVSSLFFLVAVTGICIFASAYDVIFQILHPSNANDTPNYKNLAVFGGSYILLGLLATIFGFSRYVTVKLAKQAIPNAYMPILEEDLPKNVYGLVQSELDRVARLAKKAVPILKESAQPGWGKPGSVLQDTHFKTFMASTPHFIERAATMKSADLARPPNLSIAAYIHMLMEHRMIPKDLGIEYITGYERARFGGYPRLEQQRLSLMVAVPTRKRSTAPINSNRQLQQQQLQQQQQRSSIQSNIPLTRAQYSMGIGLTRSKSRTWASSSIAAPELAISNVESLTGTGADDDTSTTNNDYAASVHTNNNKNNNNANHGSHRQSHISYQSGHHHHHPHHHSHHSHHYGHHHQNHNNLHPQQSSTAQQQPQSLYPADYEDTDEDDDGLGEISEETYMRFMKVLSLILNRLGWDAQAQQAYEEELRLEEERAEQEKEKREQERQRQLYQAKYQSQRESMHVSGGNHYQSGSGSGTKTRSLGFKSSNDSLANSTAGLNQSSSWKRRVGSGIGGKRLSSGGSGTKDMYANSLSRSSSTSSFVQVGSFATFPRADTYSQRTGHTPTLD